MEHLRELVQFVTDCAARRDLSPARLKETELVAEEALVNVIRHAYKDGSGDVEITCEPDKDERLLIEIADSGIAFDFLSMEDPDITAGISERKEGGLGVYFIKKLMDEVKYRREGDKNILSFIVLKNGTR